MKQKGIVFLFIGLGALTLFVLVGLFVFYPKENSPKSPPANQLTNAAGTPVPQTFDPVEWSRTGQGPVTAPAGGTASVATPQTSPSADGFVVTMNPPANTAPATGTTTAPVTAPSTSSQVTFPSPATVSSAPETRVDRVKEVKAPEVKRPVYHHEAAPHHEAAVRHYPAAPVLRTQFWIQVGAYTNRYQAERMSQALKGQGLKGTLVTAFSKGRTIIRVRVGPYAEKQEAEKFLAWVKPVKGMEASFITVVHAR